jgi:hypothetical protein
MTSKMFFNFIKLIFGIIIFNYEFLYRWLWATDLLEHFIQRGRRQIKRFYTKSFSLILEFLKKVCKVPAFICWNLKL